MRKFSLLLSWLVILSIIFSGYFILAKFFNLFNDATINSWSNVNPVLTLILGFLSLKILYTSLKYYDASSKLVKWKNSLISGSICAAPFLLFGTLGWSDSWSEIPTSLMFDGRELGDDVWRFGSPLTFLIIDFPIYLRHKYHFLQNFWSDFWALPLVIMLFIAQFGIYIHGIRLLINSKIIYKSYVENINSFD